MLGQSEAIRDYQFRFPLFYWAIVILFSLMSLRLVYLQVYRGQVYRTFSEQNSLRQEKLIGPRGQIFDRNMQLLVDNRLQLDVTMTPQFVPNPKMVIDKLATLVDEPADRLLDRYKQKAAGAFKFQPVSVIENAPWPVIVRLESNKSEMLGVEVEPKIRRSYLNQKVGAHVLGYLAEVTKKDLEDSGRTGGLKDYALGDWIGRAGLEKQMEKYLRGTDGIRYVEVNAHGHRVAGADSRQAGVGMLADLPGDINPKPGKNVVLTIDEDLQIAAAKAMEGKMGAVVALDPRTGEILAMLSQPGFDPTEMSTSSAELWTSILKNPYAPLRNKAIQDHYPAGSTFKTFTALAGLDAGVINEQTTVFCPGYFKFGRRLYSCHKKEGHGYVSLKTAISGSCDVYFYQLGSRLGIDTISKMARFFGFGKKSGIDLGNEIPGLMPTEQWKKDSLKQEWTPGETLSASIGQGYNLVTPLQIAMGYATLVNGGNLYRPYVVSRIQNNDGQVFKSFSPELVSNYKINPKHLELIKQGLFDVANAPGGTAVRFLHTPEGLISGKSGTAQVISMSREDLFKPCQNLPFEKRHHAWFVGYAPRENPEIVVSVLGMHECGGSRSASPVVRAVIDRYIEKKREAERIVGPYPSATL